jgi:hypothetical protein
MNADTSALPNPGTCLSFSASTGVSLPVRYRVVAQSGDRTQDILRAYPQFISLLVGRPPILANAYPATLGEFPSAISVDICQRPANAWRALALAADLNVAVIFTGQPLYIAELLRGYAALDLQWPKVVVAAVGGYVCPASLERFLTRLLPEGVVKLVLHCYGVAEADFACLVGNRTRSGRICQVPAGFASFHRTNGR